MTDTPGANLDRQSPLTGFKESWTDGENILLTFSIYNSDPQTGKHVQELRLTHKLLKGHAFQLFKVGHPTDNIVARQYPASLLLFSVTAKCHIFSLKKPHHLYSTLGAVCCLSLLL